MTGPIRKIMEFDDFIQKTKGYPSRLGDQGIDNATLQQVEEVRKHLESAGAFHRPLTPIDELPAIRERIRELAGLTAPKDYLQQMLLSAEQARDSAMKLMVGYDRRDLDLEYQKLIGIDAKTLRDFQAQLNPGISADRYVAEHLAEVRQKAGLAQAALMGIHGSGIGAGLGIGIDVEKMLADRSAAFSSSYQELFQSFERSETSLLHLRPSLIEFPAIEFFNEVDLLSAISDSKEDEFEDERIIVRKEIQESSDEKLDRLLGAVNPALVKMREGAKFVMSSHSPDKIRQGMTSLRELLREVIESLSPDDLVRAWSQSPEHLKNNKPTRLGRLGFISRDLDHGPFAKFLRKDIDVVLEMFQVLNGATHEATSPLNERQAMALIARAENTMLLLLTTADGESPIQ